MILLEIEARRLEVDTILEETCLEDHVANEIIIRPNPISLIRLMKFTLHLFDLLSFHVDVWILEQIEVDFVDYSVLKKEG